MFRMWGKLWEKNHLIKDITIEDASSDTRTHKIFHSLEEICMAFDLGKPIWLDTNIREFQKHSKVKFYQDSFIEEIDFDYLELQVLEED